jgi:hypothetical protein
MSEEGSTGGIVIFHFYGECDVCHRSTRCLGFGRDSKHIDLSLCWSCLCFIRGKLIWKNQAYVTSELIKRHFKK